ncbi:hypothetical protein BJV78DRAFT_1156112 [Lactifluus subvellereus]|nr:hypothetical protein BJV78DRAFT_1156112 [Lactifluus subvellereus]
MQWFLLPPFQLRPSSLTHLFFQSSQNRAPLDARSLLAVNLYMLAGTKLWHSNKGRQVLGAVWREEGKAGRRRAAGVGSCKPTTSLGRGMVLLRPNHQSAYLVSYDFLIVTPTVAGFPTLKAIDYIEQAIVVLEEHGGDDKGDEVMTITPSPLNLPGDFFLFTSENMAKKITETSTHLTVRDPHLVRWLISLGQWHGYSRMYQQYNLGTPHSCRAVFKPRVLSRAVGLTTQIAFQPSYIDKPLGAPTSLRP